MLSEQVKSDLKNPWLRGVIAIVVVTVSVNIGFISYAFWFPPNLVVKDYYEKGKNYFHNAEIRRQESATAWRLQLLVPEHTKLDHQQMYRVYVVDHAGQPVRHGRVTLFAYRPSNAQDDFRVELPYADIGTFAAKVRFSLPGHWDLIARITAGDRQYDVAKRIFVEK